MCQFGNETKIIAELNLTENEALRGWRSNYIINPFNEKEKFLKSLNQDYIWPKNGPAIGNPNRLNSEGIYNYYNYYYYYNHNYYYNYYIQIATILYGKIFKYDEGYRSQFCKPTHLVILDKDSDWFTNQNTVKFANHFNSTVEQLAKEYDCEVIEWSKRDQVK